MLEVSWPVVGFVSMSPWLLSHFGVTISCVCGWRLPVPDCCASISLCFCNAMKHISTSLSLLIFLRRFIVMESADVTASGEVFLMDKNSNDRGDDATESGEDNDE